MNIYIGIDIGTTNTKAVAVSQSGRVEKVIKAETPKKTAGSVQYFDIARIESIVDAFTESLSAEYTVLGIGFSSVGESVVPVAKGRALHDPLVWHESCTSETEDERRIIEKYTSYRITGIAPYIRLSLYKMLWMMRNLDLAGVEYWLPISSYLIYRKTGAAVWDTSQACRSFLIDVHERRWNTELFAALALPGSLGELSYMGARIGTESGITYGLAGHDHVTGLFAVYNFFDRGNVIYDSMGTAAVITAIADEREGELHLDAPDGAAGGAIGAAFRDRQYYLLKPFRYFGLFISRLMELTGRGTSSEAFREVNDSIAKLSSVRPKAYFAVGGDVFLGNARERLNILNMSLDVKDYELVQSGYVYLGVISRLMLSDLMKYCGGSTPYLAGGAVTKDEVFLRYKASILGREILVLDTDEISALGAAVAAAVASGDEDMLASFRANPLVRKRIYPDERIARELEGVYEEYGEIMKSGSSSLFR